MAFNPFHRVRKHQKAIFAILTIVSMVSFILISGLSSGGDFASWLQQKLIGGMRQTDIATLYGSAVTQRELVDLMRQRQIADFFMMQATLAARRNRADEIKPPNFEQMPQEQQQLLARQIEGDPTIRLLMSRLPNMFQPNRNYFGGSTRPEALLDFKIWLHQADVLGIRLSDADINQEVKRLTENKLTRRDSGLIEKVLGQQYRDYFTPEVLMTALGSEFRVRMAQLAVLGIDAFSQARPPAPVTPQEFWNYYKEMQTKTDFTLLPVKVEDYLAQVKDQPNEKELKDLYEKFKNQEYNPDARDPGFKQPRRIQVEWVAARSDDPFYVKAAEQFLPSAQAAQIVAAALPSSPLAGLTPAVALSVPAALDVLVPAGRDSFGKDTTVYQEYENIKYNNYRSPSYTRPLYRPGWNQTNNLINEANLDRPANYAAAVGQAVGALGSKLASINASATILGTATLNETMARSVRGSEWVLSGAMPTPILAAAVGAYLTPKDEFQPLPRVRSLVEEQLLKALAQDLVVNNLNTVQKEIEAKSKDKDKKALQDYLAKAVQEYHLTTGKTADGRDQFRNKIDDDPAMKPLREAYMHPAPIGDREGKNFARMFFADAKPYAVEKYPRSQFGAFEEDRTWKIAPQAFLYWKTDDQPSRTLPFENAEVRKDVERAWRFQKARELAKKDADQLAVKAHAEKGDALKLKDFAARQEKKPIDLPGLSKLMRSPSPFPNQPARYDPPRVEEDKVPHGGFDFASKLMPLLDKPKGDTLVVADQPEAVYYVAVLLDKREPSLEDFFRVYRDAALPDEVRRDPLLSYFEQERYIDYIRNVTTLLREQAKLKVNDKNMKELETSFTPRDE